MCCFTPFFPPRRHLQRPLQVTPPSEKALSGVRLVPGSSSGSGSGPAGTLGLRRVKCGVNCERLSVLLYFSHLLSDWNMFQVSGSSPTYANCLCAVFFLRWRSTLQLHRLQQKHDEVSQIPRWKLGAITHTQWVTSTLQVVTHSTDGGLHSEPLWPRSTMHSLSREHKGNPSMQHNQAGRKTTEKCAASPVNKTRSKKQRTKVWSGIGEGGELIPSSGGGGKQRCFIENCSYLHHNVKGVLVEQEHKKQTEKLVCVRAGTTSVPETPAGGAGLQRVRLWSAIPHGSDGS